MMYPSEDPPVHNTSTCKAEFRRDCRFDRDPPKPTTTHQLRLTGWLAGWLDYLTASTQVFVTQVTKQVCTPCGERRDRWPGSRVGGHNSH